MPGLGLQKRLPLSPPVVFRYVNGESALFRGWNLGVRRTADAFEFRVQASKTIADDLELMEPVLGIAPMEIDSAVRFVAPGRRVWAEYGMRNGGTSGGSPPAAWKQPRPDSRCMDFGLAPTFGTAQHCISESRMPETSTTPST